MAKQNNAVSTEIRKMGKDHDMLKSRGKIGCGCAWTGRSRRKTMKPERSFRLPPASDRRGLSVGSRRDTEYVGPRPCSCPPKWLHGRARYLLPSSARSSPIRWSCLAMSVLILWTTDEQISYRNASTVCANDVFRRIPWHMDILVSDRLAAIQIND